MNLKTSLLVLISIWGMSAIAQAKDIDIQAGDVRVSQDKNGNIQINSGNSRLKVPSHRSYRGINQCSRRNQLHQQVTQVTRIGSTVTRTHVSNHHCN